MFQRAIRDREKNGSDDNMASGAFRRKLNTQVDADEFVENVLGILDDDGSQAAKIVCAELGLQVLEDSPTVSSKNYRVAKYRLQKDRKRLQDRILSELITMTQLENDDDICLGSGGAKPQNLQAGAQAYIVSGPPASGKSTITNTLAAENGAYVLDSDHAKRKFPEYHFYNGGASLVHQESDQIIFGPGRQHLLEFCIYSRYNIVVPLVGRTDESMKDICEKLIEAGYTIHIVNVVLPPEQCAARAFRRYCETDRYVPLSYIFDEVGTRPENIYFHLKREFGQNPHFGSFTQLSTDVPHNCPPKVLEATENSPFHT